MASEFDGIQDLVRRDCDERRATFMTLPFDPLREAILLQLNRAINIRRAQGASFEAVGREFGLSKKALDLIAGRDDGSTEQRVARARPRSRYKSGLLRN